MDFWLSPKTETKEEPKMVDVSVEYIDIVTQMFFHDMRF